MLQKRFIPVLLIQNKKLVKSIQFSNFNYLGDPINAVKIFSTKTVDELLVIDINASKNKFIDFDYLIKISNECFIPLTYCGGIKDLESMKSIYNIGFEKIAIDSATINDCSFLQEAVAEFGSSSVVAAITIKKNFFGKYKRYNFLNKKMSKENLIDIVNRIESCKPGEIFINNYSEDGLMNGYDLKILESLTANINIPVTVCGGAGNINDLKQLLSLESITGAAAGSVFVYSSKERGIMINYPEK